MGKKAIVIVGATATGKSDVAFELAKVLGTDIISADSRQFFCEMNIGTAKPHEHWLNRIKHHFVNHLSIVEEFNVYQFRKEARIVLETLFNRNKVPIIVGGSGLYVRALVQGIIEHEAIDEKIQSDLLTKKNSKGKEFLYEELQRVDPKSAATMLPQNWKRVIRALEVFYQTGKPISQHFEEQELESNIDFLQFGLNWERAKLYERINLRVDKMIEDGLVEEVKSLQKKFPNYNLNALNTVGYKEIFSYLKNEIELEEAIRFVKRNSRHYAKRQLTWFKKDVSIQWIDCTENFSPKKIAHEILGKLSGFSSYI